MGDNVVAFSFVADFFAGESVGEFVGIEVCDLTTFWQICFNRALRTFLQNSSIGFEFVVKPKSAVRESTAKGASFCDFIGGSMKNISSNDFLDIDLVGFILWSEFPILSSVSQPI